VSVCAVLLISSFLDLGHEVSYMSAVIFEDYLARTIFDLLQMLKERPVLPTAIAGKGFPPSRGSRFQRQWSLQGRALDTEGRFRVGRLSLKHGPVSPVVVSQLSRNQS
jgi:hypothetical protein